MSRPFRPGCHIKSENYWFDHKTVWVEYPTYRELKKHLPELIKQNDYEDVHVFRTRRGEWGEWFEIWTLSNGNPVIQKQGWN